MLPWQRHIRQLNHQKPKFVLLACLLPFLATEGLRVLEKMVNETLVSKTVFSHLNSKPVCFFVDWHILVSSLYCVHSRVCLRFCFDRCKTSQCNIEQLLAWGKFTVSIPVNRCYGCRALYFILLIIIYMKILLDSDWLRVVQFKCNTSAKSVTPVQKV